MHLNRTNFFMNDTVSGYLSLIHISRADTGAYFLGPSITVYMVQLFCSAVRLGTLPAELSVHQAISDLRLCIELLL